MGTTPLKIPQSLYLSQTTSISNSFHLHIAVVFTRQCGKHDILIKPTRYSAHAIPLQCHSMGGSNFLSQQIDYIF
jgi:hypothetical protein